MKPAVMDPKTSTRAEAYELWMDAPNPMVTFFKTLDVAPLIRCSRRRGYKFNMLLGWCIGRAASEIKEFYLLPVGRELLQYDSIAVNTIVKNKTGEVSSCDVPFSESLAKFNADYLCLTRTVAESCENHDLPDSMVIGTSAIVDTEIDGAVGMNSGIFNNPFMIWGEVSQGAFQNDAHGIVPIPPHPDGRRACGTVFTSLAGGDLPCVTRIRCRRSNGLL